MSEQRYKIIVTLIAESSDDLHLTYSTPWAEIPELHEADDFVRLAIRNAEVWEENQPDRSHTLRMDGQTE